MKQYWETGDIAVKERVGTATVRADVAAGHLQVAATTKRGTRLFSPEGVEAYRRVRRERVTRRRTMRGGAR